MLKKLRNRLFPEKKPAPVADRTAAGRQNEKDRIAWIAAQLQMIPAGNRILDAGAGELRYKPFCAHLEYVAQDFGSYDGQGDTAGLQTGSWDQSGIDIICDITAIPVPDASFDAILCAEVLEHVPEPELALREFARILRPGGTLILTAPFCSLTHFAPYHFHTGFSRYYWEDRLRRYGFTAEQISPNGNFFEFLAQELRRVPSTASRYTADSPDAAEQNAVNTVLNMLGRMSAEDAGSHELLCFGYHVAARKGDGA